jgi:FkbM family methyltransferase
VLSLAAWTARVLPMPLKRLVYRVRPLARLVRGGLNRAAPEGLTEVDVAAGALAGCRLALDLQTEKDYWLGTYEPEVQTALAELARPGMIAYDVGANVGYISLQLARRTGAEGKVFAFEALPANLDRLRRNLALNGLDGRVEVVAAAVLDEMRPVRFLVGPSGGMGKAEGSAGRQEFTYSETVEVDGISLDDFVYTLDRPAPDLIKMDIEGGEVLALPGMWSVLQEAHPVLLMELHGPESAQAAWDTLTAAGYRLCRMDPGFSQVSALDELDWKAYLVAFPEKEASANRRK